MRVGIVGLGRAGMVHLQACTAVSGLEVSAVHDPELGSRRAAEAVGIAAYADLAQMLDVARLDAVSICVPPADHARLAMRCLERGLHVLCEKPLALTSDDVREMCATAHRHRRLLLVASKFRHVPEIVHARELLRGGELGELTGFELSFCSRVDMASRWNAQPARAGGGVIIDNGCHAFDILTFLFGSITSVQARQLKPVQDLPVEDSASVRVTAAEGVVGDVHLSWSWATGRDTYLVIHGTRGSIEIGWHSSRLRRDGKQWREFGKPYERLDAHRRMYACFLEAMIGTGEGWITTSDCLCAVATVEAAYRSLRSGTGKPVRVEADSASHYESIQPEMQLMEGAADESGS